MISVVICTYNRGSQLEKCLSSFHKVNTNVVWELVLVNNASTDNTEEVAEQFRQTSPLQIKYVVEKQKGLGNARNCGVHHASFDIVAFTDDDCYPEEDYIDKIVASFANHQTSAKTLGFVGGRVELYDKDDLPVTIQTSQAFESFNKQQVVLPGQIHGANFIFSKHAIIESGCFDPRFGAGADFPCEDIDLMASCLANGFTGIYDPSIVVYHHHGRRTHQELAQLHKSYDIGRGAFLVKHVIRKSGVRLPYLKYWIRQSTKTRFKSFKNEITAAFQYIRGRKS